MQALLALTIQATLCECIEKHGTEITHLAQSPLSQPQFAAQRCLCSAIIDVVMENKHTVHTHTHTSHTYTHVCV